MAETLIINALIEGNLGDLMRGKNGLYIHNPYLDTPTEPIKVFEGLMAHFGNSSSSMDEFLEEVQEMSREPEYSWFAPYYLFDIIANASRFSSIDLQLYVSEVLDNVRKHEQYLRGLKRWAGTQDPDGCWGIVDRLVKQIKKYHEGKALKINWEA